MLLTKAKKLLFDILFPPLCLACGELVESTCGESTELPRRSDITSVKEVDYTPPITSPQGAYADTLLCKSCASKIILNTTLFCPVCRARLAENRQICNHHKINYPSTTYYLAAAGNYNDPILKTLIHALKYQKITALAPTLGAILANYLQTAVENCVPPETIIIPIPLHPRRERARGFNQAKLLAHEIAQQLTLPMQEPLKRIKYTSPQAELRDNNLRKENVKKCFTIQPETNLQRKTILLIDDVFTSGSTMDEAVAILKTRGARRIIATVVAKT